MGYVKYIGVCGWLSVSTEAEEQGPGGTLELACSGEEGTRANPRNSQATAAAVSARTLDRTTRNVLGWRKFPDGSKLLS